MSISTRSTPRGRPVSLSTSIFLLISCLAFCTTDVGAQNPPVSNSPQGYWTGAFIRDGAVQIVTAEFYTEKDALRIETETPDRPFAPPRGSAVESLPGGALVFDTIYGRATMIVDEMFQEMIGQVGDSTPPVSLHLKRSLRPPAPRIRAEEVAFKSGDLLLAGTLVLPEGAGPHPVAVYAHGRGCQGRTNYLARARLLARYGVAGFAFDKRGVGASKGSCESATFEEEVADFVAAIEMLGTRAGIDGHQIGIISQSAGGWVAARAANRTRVPLAFIITSVGPATSVREQQFDNARLISRDLNLKPEDEKLFMRYVELMFAEGEPRAQYAEMQELLAHGKRTGWGAEFLDETDVAPSADRIKNLWVRRFNYDPTEDLKKIRVPFLAFYGGSDRVVPPETNEPVLRRLLNAAGNKNFRIIVLPRAGHGLVQDEQLRRLTGATGVRETYYWKFGRLGATYLQEMVDFLRANLKIDGQRSSTAP